MGNYLKLFKNNEEFNSLKEKQLLSHGHLIDDIDLKNIFYIKYTATKKLTKNFDGCFNTPVIDHTFENGTGYIFFDEPVISITKAYTFDSVDLTSIELPNSLVNIAAYCFDYAINLESIKLSNDITSIGEKTFYYAEKLKRMNSDVDGVINLPTNLTSVGDSSFCGAMSSGNTTVTVNMPNSLKTINNGSFSYIKKVTEWIIPNSVTFIGNASFAQCANVTSLTISSSIDTIKRQTFRDYTSLETVIIPEGIKTIEEGAFEQKMWENHGPSKITKVVFPSTIENIGRWAFDDANYYKPVEFDSSVVICYAETPPNLYVSDYQYKTLPSKCKVYVPDNSVNLYKNKGGGWDDYKNVIYPISELPN